jgi:hypothetical protein
MKIKTSSGEWILHFKHQRFLAHDATSCKIHVAPCAIEENRCICTFVLGVARCSPQDQFSKAIGRKIALERALTQIGLNYNERKDFWAGYFAQCPPRKKG